MNDFTPSQSDIPCYFKEKIDVKSACTCAFHVWLRSGGRSKGIDPPSGVESALALPETLRLIRFNALDPTSTLVESTELDEEGPVFFSAEELWSRSTKRRAVANPKVSTGISRLVRFVAVLRLLGRAPWAGMTFEPNEKILKRLIAGHLSLIVGEKPWSLEKESLYPLIDAESDLGDAQNTVWITNRQQGKTTTLSRFLAALSIMSPAGGNLICVYSTNLDRAQELTRAAKKYIYWAMSDPDAVKEFDSMGLQNIKLVTDNERVYSVTGQYVPGVINTVIARPKSPDSCRGDAPRAAIFDEIGFVTADFWYKIAKRVFTCATTPPPIGGFFANFCDNIIEQNTSGNYFFRLINHSLVCQACFDNNSAEKCVHRLGLVPPWKSLLRFTRMKTLVPAKRIKDYQAEVFGVMQPEGSRYLPKKVVDAAIINRPFEKRNLVPTGTPERHIVSDIYISIDPASHQRSSMGIVAMLYGVNGEVVILGMASVSAEKCDVVQVQMVVGSFVDAIIRHLWIRQRFRTNRIRIVPIIECNSNEILAMSILDAVKRSAQRGKSIVGMPFNKNIFGSGVSDGIGVWTTDRNKLAGIQSVYTVLLDNRLRFADGFVVVGEVYRANSSTPRSTETRELLAVQLKNIRDLPSGKVSGKTSSEEDDLAIALILGIYWSHCARATAGGGMVHLDI